MARRHRHNQGGGNQPRQRMFDLSREELFRYDALNVLDKAPIEEQHHKAFLQQVITRGARNGLDDAKDYVKEKARDEGYLDRDSRNDMLDLLDKYSKYR